MTQAPTSPDRRELESFLGTDVADGLKIWEDTTGRRLSLPQDRFMFRGYTDAVVATVMVHANREPGAIPEDDRNLLVKIVAVDDRREIAAHRTALQDSPAYAEKRLVAMRYESVAIPNKKILYFQDIAGGTTSYRPASRISVDDQPEVLVDLVTRVARSVASEWNVTVRADPDRELPVAQFAHTELNHLASGQDSVQEIATEAGLRDPGALWVSTPEDERTAPNPLLLCTGHPALGDRTLRVLDGPGHGDLHLDNVLLLQDDRGAHPDTFRFIDLSTYSSTAPRVRDQLVLLLSTVALFVPDLGSKARTRLIDDLCRPDRPAYRRQDPELTRAIAEVYAATADVVTGQGFQEHWQEQYLVGLAATALRFTTFSNLEHERRWWFLRLACQAARQYFESRSISIPNDLEPVTLRNPFGPEPPPAREPAAGATPGRRGLDGFVLGQLPPDDNRPGRLR